MSDEYITYLSPEAYDKLLDAINNPKPPNQALIDLMRRVPIWDRPSEGDFG